MRVLPGTAGNGAPLLAEVVARWLPWWLAAVVAASVALAGTFLYLQDRRLISARRGWLLTAVRLAVFLLITLLLVDPACIERRRTVVPPEVLILVDASRSMSLVDGHADPEQAMREARALGLETVSGKRRIDLARRVLQGGWLEELGATYRLSLDSLHEELDEDASRAGGAGTRHREELTPPEALAALERIEPSAPLTDLATPLGRATLDQAARRFSGIVLLSDGNHNASGDPREAAHTLAEAGVPLAAVGIGATTEPRDLSLRLIHPPRRAFSGDEIEVEVALEATDVAAREVTLLVEGDDEALLQRVLGIGDEDGVRRDTLAFTVKGSGRKRITISASEVEGEITDRNNSASFFLEVLEEEVRVLYLDRGPRYEFRYLSGLWERSDTIDLDAFLLTRPPRRSLPPDFPLGRDALFAYDVIVLGDIAPRLFTGEERALIGDFVTERGGALILISGEKDMPYSWSGTSLEEMLPVELLSPAPAVGLGGRLASGAPPIVPSAKGERAEELRLVPGRTRNLELWSLLEGPLWVTPVAGPRPGASELAFIETELRREDLSAQFRRDRPGREDTGLIRVPVFVTRPAGAGSVFYAGIDSTWRWRRAFGDRFQEKFWGGVLRWAIAQRLGACDNRACLGTDRAAYAVPDPVTIECALTDSTGGALEDVWVDAVVQVVGWIGAGGDNSIDGNDDSDDRRERREPTGAAAAVRLRLHPIPASGGRYRGELGAEALEALLADTLASERTPSERSIERTIAVECRARLEIAELSGYNEREDRAELRFLLELARAPELFDFTQDRPLLEEIGRLSGGGYLPLERYREAPALLADRGEPEERTVVNALIDHPLVLALAILGLLAVEWILRKLWRLS